MKAADGLLNYLGVSLQLQATVPPFHSILNWSLESETSSMQPGSNEIPGNSRLSLLGGGEERLGKESEEEREKSKAEEDIAHFLNLVHNQPVALEENEDDGGHYNEVMRLKNTSIHLIGSSIFFLHIHSQVPRERQVRRKRALCCSTICRRQPADYVCLYPLCQGVRDDSRPSKDGSMAIRQSQRANK